MTVTATFRRSTQITDTEAALAGGNASHQSQPTAYQKDLAVYSGPSPGIQTIPTGGKIISFRELLCPGPVRVHNLSTTAGDYVEYGLWDPNADKFWPIGEVEAGAFDEFTLSRNLLEQYEGTGTGTTSAFMHFFMKAHGSTDQKVLINAFDDPR